MLEERVRFVLAYVGGEGGLSELCREFGISRKTAYKFLARYRAERLDGLQDRSRAPRVHPNAITAAVVDLVIQARRAHPSWGPRKLLPFLARRYPGLQLPAASTLSHLFRREGLAGRRRRRRYAPASAPFAAARAANDLWCADFKGWFRAGNGERCEPLTITDSVTRFALACDVLDRVTMAHARPVFERAFRDYGLPRALRTDNGSPFASRGLAGLTRLSAWWVHLGIRPERIAPGQPQQNGRHERFHLTLQHSVVAPPQPTRLAQQRVCQAFLREFNGERPHAALANRTPADLYVPSPRPYPPRLAPLEYPPSFEVRSVRADGKIRWQGRYVFISEALVGERVGLVRSAETAWTLHFGPLQLGHYDERQSRLIEATPPRWTNGDLGT